VRALARLHRRLITLLAGLAGALLALMALAIVLDVVVRNLGFQPPGHTLALTEYGLLYITMLAAPWLVREKGHVRIELLTAAVGARTRVWLGRLVAALCILTCAVIGWYGLEVTLGHYRRGAMDVRSFDLPRWLLTASVPLSFGLMALEFARFLLGRGALHTGEPGIHE
jgi:TRAP-type C4-dicarboxylate transport system permease small subunit